MSEGPELLAPAGEAEAGYAAIHYGADAVYLGLDRFSARAEAINFTPDALAGLAGFAHSRQPRRNVYLALNTLVKEHELAQAAETLVTGAECGVDAVIVQDLGVAGLVRKYFPSLKLHASTQAAIHNLDGAKAARDLGFDRVTLARELTLREIERIVAGAGLEIEIFIHGALCYSYSGLCLFSSLKGGRSGNRGRCSYPCREAAWIGPNDAPTHPFSLKDLAVGPRVLDLARAGVASLKIEGRKKSPLYVAATVDYYRRLLDGVLKGKAIPEAEAALKTIFARPWTTFFLDGARNPDAADLDVVGHRGAPLGVVEEVVAGREGGEVVFTATLGVEAHDGIQVDVPGEARPFGFPVDSLRAADGKGWRRVFTAEPGSRLAVGLPEDAPALKPGWRLYLSSSQAVKRSFPYEIPKAGAYSPRAPVDIDVAIEKNSDVSTRDKESAAKVTATVSTVLPGLYKDLVPARGESPGLEVAAMVEAACQAFAARDAEGAEEAARAAFGRLGDSRYTPRGWSFANPGNLFVKPGRLNALRRDLITGLDEAYNARRAALAAAWRDTVSGASGVRTGASDGDCRWSVCVDKPEYLDAFGDEDFTAAEEVMIGLGHGAGDGFSAKIAEIAERCGREKIRFFPPLIGRGRGMAAVAAKVEHLLAEGWRKWLVPGLAGWRMLRESGVTDLIADWPLYALNHRAVGELSEMGFSGFTLSPEDDAENYAAILGSSCLDSHSAWVMVYSDLPFFISAACVHSQLGLCNSGTKRDDTTICGEKSLNLEMESGWKGEIAAVDCGSVVTGDKPYSLCGHVDALRKMGAKRLRVDLRWRRYGAGEALFIWRAARSGGLANSHSGNYLRGLL